MTSTRHTWHARHARHTRHAPTRSKLRHSTPRHQLTQHARLPCQSALRYRLDTINTHRHDRHQCQSTPHRHRIDTASTPHRHDRHLRHSETSGLNASWVTAAPPCSRSIGASSLLAAWAAVAAATAVAAAGSAGDLPLRGDLRRRLCAPPCRKRPTLPSLCPRTFFNFLRRSAQARVDTMQIRI